MFKIKIADQIIKINHQYDYVKELCLDYIVYDKPDFEVFATEKEILQESKRDKEQFPFCYYESSIIYRKICQKMADFRTFLCHAAVVSLDGKAFMFMANSGTGKSTHAALWENVFGERATIINGDKPLIKQKESVFFAFGTPWCGKEHWNKNTSVPIQGACFLKQGKENQIIPLSSHDSIKPLLTQIFLPPNHVQAQKVLSELNLLLKQVPFYQLTCTISEQAVLTAYERMKKYNAVK